MSLFSTILGKIMPSANANPVDKASDAIKDAANMVAQVIDVDSILGKLAETAGEKLNWKTSIVDLLKLLKMDSSLTARQSLAKELGFSGDMSDSAAMNTWLSSQVIEKIKNNAGKIPESFKQNG